MRNPPRIVAVLASLLALLSGGPVTISADRKSFSLKGADNWVWTYTPSPL